MGKVKFNRVNTKELSLSASADRDTINFVDNILEPGKGLIVNNGTVYGTEVMTYLPTEMYPLIAPTPINQFQDEVVLKLCRLYFKDTGTEQFWKDYINVAAVVLKYVTTPEGKEYIGAIFATTYYKNTLFISLAKNISENPSSVQTDLSSYRNSTTELPQALKDELDYFFSCYDDNTIQLNFQNFQEFVVSVPSSYILRMMCPGNMIKFWFWSLFCENILTPITEMELNYKGTIIAAETISEILNLPIQGNNDSIITIGYRIHNSDAEMYQGILKHWSIIKGDPNNMPVAYSRLLNFYTYKMCNYLTGKEIIQYEAD